MTTKISILEFERMLEELMAELHCFSLYVQSSAISDSTKIKLMSELIGYYDNLILAIRAKIERKDKPK